MAEASDGYRIIGKRIGRLEGLPKVQGQTRFTADQPVPGEIWGRVLRSPFPHARIRRIDTSKALQMPGVRAVLTSANLPDVLIGRRLRDMRLLATDRVRFVGERVAAVAADTKEQAEQALSAIEVDYEELPAVFDPLDSMADSAPLLHEELASYPGLPQPGDPALPRLHPEGRTELRDKNVYMHVSWGTGDPDEGFAEADHVFEHTFSVPRVHQAYMEPHACVVWDDADGRTHIRATNKSPFMMRRHLAEAAMVPEERIVVEPVPVGGDFGGKGSMADVPIAYHLSKAAGRPVRMGMDYTEELTAGSPRFAAVITVRSGVTSDGRITARSAKVFLNGGAYGGFTPMTTLPLIKDVGGVYRIPHFRVDGYSVYTNCVPGGHFRGPGQPQVIFAVESHMDLIAKQLELDPVEFRLRNVVSDGDLSPAGEAWERIRAAETLKEAAKAIGWDEPKPDPHVGRGLSLYEQHAIGGPTGGVLSLDPDGGLTWHTGVFDTGAGAHLAFRQIVAEEMGIDIERVRVEAGDTDSVPYEQGPAGSRLTHTASKLLVRATHDLRDRLSTLAAELMDRAESGLQYCDGTFHTEDKRISLEALAEVASPEVARVTVEEVHEEATVTGFVAQAVEVRVDPETGQLDVLKAVTAHDVGRILNPLSFHGQIQGALVQALGYGLMEELKVEDGRVSTPSLADYKIPTMPDVPPLTTVLLEPGQGQGVYETKSISEAAISGIAPAIANAVEDAVGVRATELPLSAEKVYRLLHPGQ